MPTTTRSGASLPTMEATSLHSSTFREQVFGIVTGRDATGAGAGKLRAQLIAAFGSSRRDPTRPDTAEAAKRLGVTQRTVQRWVKDDHVSAKRRSDVERAARQAMTTKRGRARALRAARAAGTAGGTGARNQGLVIGGLQGVESDTELNYRDRDTNVGFTDADLAALQDVWAEHGSEGAAAYLHQHMDQHYARAWHMPEIDEISWGTSRNYSND